MTAALSKPSNQKAETPKLAAFDPRKEGQRLLKKWYASLGQAEERGEPVAYVFVMGNAVEILRSFDFQVVFPEINSLQTAVRKMAPEYLQLAEDYGMSPDVCSYVKADVGLLLKDFQHPMGHLPKPSLAIASNMCNTFIKWAEIWERWLGVPAFVFDLPGQRASGWDVRTGDTQHMSDSRWITAQLKELITICERITGTHFDPDRLAQVEADANEMTRLWLKVMALNRERPAPYNAMLDGLTYVGIMNVFRGLPEGVRYMRQLYEHLSAKVAEGAGRVADERFRLIFSGTPCYVSMRRLVELFERWGGVFAYSDYLTFAAGGLDAAGVEYDTSRPLESLAEVTALAAQRGLSHQFFAHEQLAQQVADYHADGLVFHGIKSCRFVSTGMLDTREFIIRKFGIPSLYIESDLIDPRYWSDAQIKNRVDAFFEALQQRMKTASEQPALER